MDPREKALDRARKCLRLAQGQRDSSPEEALTAAQRAAAILTKAGLSWEDLAPEASGGQESEPVRDLFQRTQRIHPPKYRLLRVVAEALGGKVAFSRGHGLWLYAPSQQTYDAIQAVYDAMWSRCEKLATALLKGSEYTCASDRYRRSVRGSFRAGFRVGLKEALEKGREEGLALAYTEARQADDPTTALVLVDKALAVRKKEEEAMTALYKGEVKTVSTGWTAQPRFSEPFRKGVEAGKTSDPRGNRS